MRLQGREAMPCPWWIRVLFVITVICQAAYGQTPQSFQESLPVFKTARDAHSLLPAEAARHYPVHLKAVVTYFDPYIDQRHTALFVHDSTGSIFVALPSQLSLSLEPGTEVEVRGVTGSGDYAPIVERAQVKIIGHSQVPATAPRVTMSQLFSGAVDGQWVEIEGLVHAVRYTGRNIVLDIATLGG